MAAMKKTWPPKTIGIIGGKGLMGSFFAKFFRKNGFRTLISDLDTILSNKKLVQMSDMVVVAVPIHVTKKVIREILPFTRPQQLITDVTSLKVFPVKEMLKGKANVIGMHPMFRPGSTGFKNQTVVLCPARAQKEQIRWLRQFFKKHGAKTTNMTPQKHDQLMAVVQVLVHFHSMVFGQTLKNLKTNLKDLFMVMSPIYRFQFNVASRIFAQNPLLYASIGMENPETKKVTKVFCRETDKLQRILATKNLPAFIKDFKKTASFLGPFSKQALRESDRLLASFRNHIERYTFSPSSTTAKVS